MRCGDPEISTDRLCERQRVVGYDTIAGQIPIADQRGISINALGLPVSEEQIHGGDIGAMTDCSSDDDYDEN
jgi:hypothetical protein